MLIRFMMELLVGGSVYNKSVGSLVGGRAKLYSHFNKHDTQLFKNEPFFIKGSASIMINKSSFIDPASFL